jgi:3-methylcrotonyl-CoA carboxylase alpha subunit
MGEAAVTAARAIDYRGAGTVEFLLEQSGSFYFMEMNTRLQVEHPVTEMITGQDLVEWQLLVACGEPLPLTQKNVRIHGHAFEARIYAEDPDNDFLPVTGTLDFLRPPEESRYVRVDTGVRQGDEISVYYDPMIAKLIVWDESRERALQRLASALSEYRISGTITNLDFLYNLATSRPFVEAQLDTGFIEEHRDLIFHEHSEDLAHELPLAAFALLLHKRQKRAAASCADPYSPWESDNAWRLNEPHTHRLQLHCHREDYTVEVEQRGSQYYVSCAGQQTQLEGSLDGDTLHFEIDGHRRRATLASTQTSFTLYLPEGACHFHEVLPDTGEDTGDGGDDGLRAPMNGTIVTLLAQVGDSVAANTPLLIMEAMKMEHTIRAPGNGTVRTYFYAPGDLVAGGAPLLDFHALEE